ncbi:formin-like protein 20 isoform X2 [Amphibalanus amphitrite]|uniref:formin-like protein 20 isoform X2 n=1 Tax=Amphibalanus amphitrite TaxID=1232801 RepID=UPI001C90ECC7|nr:formin-like protein 20 isoform X2 [Amphibalanus amphitrite]
MMVCEEDVVNWFQGLKTHQRIPVLRQLVHMCHPLELRFIASCVEDACRTDCLTMRSAELNANTQNVLKSLASPLDVEARSKIIIYLCLLNSTNKLCSRILSQKICDHESVAQFCDDVHKQLMDGERPSSEEQRTLDELSLLYLLASLHPSFDFIERQHYRDMCSSLNVLENKLKKLDRKEQKQEESVVPKPCCDGGSQSDNTSKSCSLCFSTSAYEHICKLRLLPRSGRHQDGVGSAEYQVNVQWSTGKYSNLVVRDSQLKELHDRLENLKQPRLPAFPQDRSETGQLNSYLQHLQGLSAVPWPRSEAVYRFFRHLADEQEQRGRGVSRPHSVYTPRPADVPGPPGRHPMTNGLSPAAGTAEIAHKLTMPLQNGTAAAPETDESSETSPAVLDEDAEVRSCTIYNSNITNGRAGSRSPSGWSPHAAAHSSGPASLTNGLARPRPAPDSGRGSGRRRPQQADSRAGSVEKEEATRTPAPPGPAPAAVPASSAGGGVPPSALPATASPAVTTGTLSHSRPVTKSVPPPRAIVTSAASLPPYSTAGGVPAPLPPFSAAGGVPAPLPPYSTAGGVPVSLPPPVAVPGVVSCAVPGAPTIQNRIISSQGGLMPLPTAVAVAAAGGHAHTLPTFSAVTAQNATVGTPPALVDGLRCGPGPASDGQLVYPALSTSSPPPAGPVPGFRPPPARPVELLSAASSPSPPAPAGSPAAPLPPPPPPPPPTLPHTLASFQQLPTYSARPPPALSLVYPGFIPSGFHPGAADMTFYTSPYPPHPVQYATVPPPRAAPQPPPPPPRPPSCYNCGAQGHPGRLCPLENAINDASQQNQFKMSFVPSISDN